MFEFSFCPVCGEDNSVEKIKITKEIPIRGEKIKVEGEVYHCSSCGEEFGPLEDTFDFIENARQIYRNKYNIPSPSDLKQFMEEYNFSLRDMEKITGIAFKTMDRYLKGAIPDPSNANLLKTIMKYPEVLLDLFDQNSVSDSPKYIKIRNKILNKIKIPFEQDCTSCIFSNVASTIEWKSEKIEYSDESFSNNIQKWKVKFSAPKEKKWKKDIIDSLVA